MPHLIDSPNRGRLRIYSRGELLAGESEAPADRVVVEWAGRLGHPSSYGLLGATPTDRPTETTIDLAHEGTPFDAALTEGSDDVVFGLSDEYRSAVRAATSVFTFPMIVCVAAHAGIGSSAIVFERLTDLAALIVWLTDEERTDEIIRLSWERAWTARDWVDDVVLPDTYRDLRAPTLEASVERDGLADQIRREVGPGHRMFGTTFSVLARDTARDDVLVFVKPNRVALVHLTFSSPSPDRVPWPIAFFVLDEQQLQDQWTLRT